MITTDKNSCDIIATIGPSTWSKDRITDLVDAGMTVARLNFSWGTYDEHTHYIEIIREVANDKGITIPIIQDLSGPRTKTDDGHGYDSSATHVITDKDKQDLEFGAGFQCEYVALSYIGSSDDIAELRSVLQGLSYKAKIIAKIERQEALDNIDSIVEASDTIMVARGDLGKAIPFEQLPFVKEELIQKAHEQDKPVIIATEFLTSMIDSSEPTRAEVSDIVDGVRDGADAIMLSNETANGNYPVEAVSVLKRVLEEALSRQ